MENEFIELNVRLKRSTYEKLEKIVRYFNEREQINNSERKNEIISVEYMIRGAIVREIEKIETFNHLITYDGDSNIGNKNAALKNRLKEIFKEKNIKQLDLCKLTGIDRSTMSMIVNNRNQPSIDHLLRIWVALDFYPLEDIFYREAEE